MNVEEAFEDLSVGVLHLDRAGVIEAEFGCDFLGAGPLAGRSVEQALPWLTRPLGELEAGRMVELLVGERLLRVSLTRALADGTTSVLVQDLTGPRRLRGALEALRQAHLTLVEGQPVGLALVDAEERFVHANATAHEIFGVPPGTLRGQSLWRFVDGAARAKVAEETRRRASGEQSTYGLDITRPDGVRRRIMVTAAPTRDSTGAWMGAVGTFRDVTDQYLAERALEASERRSRAVLAALPDVVLHLSRDGVLIDLHAEGRASLPPALLQPQGADLLKCWPDGPAAWLRGAIDRTLAGEGVEVGELCCEGGEGTKYWEARSVTVADDEVMLFLREVTERRRMAQQLEQADRMASVGSLAAGVSHFINNPLAAVVANLEFLAREVEEARPSLAPARAAELLEAIAEGQVAAARIKKTVADLRALTRPSAVGEEEQADLPSALELAVSMAGNELRMRAALELDVSPMPPVRGSPAQVGQVCLALLLNAMRALPEDRADGRISVRVRAAGAGRVALEVADTGAGIPPEQQKRAFDPFFTARPEGEIGGLGLSMSHNIVQALGGTMSLQSAPGKGTVVTVELPVAGAASAPAVPAERPARVLVVDDEELLAASLKRLLRPFEVETCTSGREAVARFVAGPFDLMLCDVMMPGFGGAEVYEAVKSQRPGRESKIVLMTGGVFSKAAKSFLDRTGCRWLQKPFALADLRQLLGAAGGT